MSYVNLPPSLYEIINTINDRITRLETAPSGPQDTADAAYVSAGIAQAQAVQAEAQATAALAQATVAYSAASQSIQVSSNTIVNSSNQLTAINGNGVTVYSGSSPYSGARVVLNSSGIAGFNSGGGTTFAIDATNGNVSITGASFTSGTIYGGSLNINGNCIINTSGFLTATGATITGTITATSGSFTGTIYASAGTIGGFTIASTYLNYGSTYFYSGGSGTYALVDNSRSISANQLIATGTAINSITTSGGIFAGSTSANSISTSGGLNISSVIYANGLGTTGSGLPVYQVQTGGNAGYLKVYTSARRFKKNITPIDSTGYSSIIDNIQPVTYDEIDDPTHTNIPGLIAEDLEQVKGVESLVVYNEEGQTIGINYDKLGVMLVLALKELKQEINTRLDKLEGK